MTAAERLAAALADEAYQSDASHADIARATRILAADPTLAQDIEDGRALRELREALPAGGYRFVEVRRAEDGEVAVTFYESGGEVIGYGPTIAAAADACREALR